MSWYMTQFSYTRETWSALTKNPVDRSVGLKALIEKMGGKLHVFCYCFGEHDGVAIYEAPDEKAAASIVLAVLDSGVLSKIQTTPLLTVEEMIAALKKAGGVTYAAPKT